MWDSPHGESETVRERDRLRTAREAVTASAITMVNHRALRLELHAEYGSAATCARSVDFRGKDSSVGIVAPHAHLGHGGAADAREDLKVLAHCRWIRQGAILGRHAATVVVAPDDVRHKQVRGVSPEKWGRYCARTNVRVGQHAAAGVLQDLAVGAREAVTGVARFR